MITISYEATDFPAHTGLNGPGDLIVTWQDLYWAAVTVGKSERDVAAFGGRHSLAELLHRVGCMAAYYSVDADRLVLSEAFHRLDPTEKGIVSYYTGMAVTKLYADQVLGVPWLMHISRYEADWAIDYNEGGTRPDLFGCGDGGNWIVAEGKGRSRVTAALVKKMKKQKSMVKTINGQPPSHRFGGATLFKKGQLALRVVDPPARRRASEVPINPAAWLADYYTPLVDLVRVLGAEREGEVRVAQLPGTELELGLPVRTIEMIDEVRRREFSRPGPHTSKKQTGRSVVELESSLWDQTPAEDHPVLETLISSAEVVSNVRGGHSDGVVLRFRDRAD